jgi:hypothetical protein
MAADRVPSPTAPPSKVKLKMVEAAPSFQGPEPSGGTRSNDQGGQGECAQVHYDIVSEAMTEHM